MPSLRILMLPAACIRVPAAPASMMVIVVAVMVVTAIAMVIVPTAAVVLVPIVVLLLLEVLHELLLEALEEVVGLLLLLMLVVMMMVWWWRMLLLHEVRQSQSTVPIGLELGDAATDATLIVEVVMERLCQLLMRLLLIERVVLLRVARIVMVVEEIVVGALDLLLHLLLVLVELEALERPHPVLVIPRELLHDLLLLFYLVVRQSSQILLLDHHNHVEQVVSHFNYFLFVLSEQFVHLLLVLSELLLAPISQPLDILVPDRLDWSRCRQLVAAIPFLVALEATSTTLRKLQEVSRCSSCPRKWLEPGELLV